MNCLAWITKYIIYILNLIFVLCGILLIIFGSIMLRNMGDFTDFSDQVNINIVPIIIVLLGCIIFIVSFFGCCGAIKQNNCCIMTYSIFMLILFALQVALVIWMFLKRKDFVSSMGKVIDTVWDSRNDHSEPMNGLQITFECCGKYGAQDYLSAGETVPKSCCGYLNAECTADIFSLKPGCRKTFLDFWDSQTNVIQYVGLGVALFELFALISGFCLASSFRQSQRGVV